MPNLAQSKKPSPEGLDGASSSVLWLSLPDNPYDQDEPLIAALNLGHAWTDNMEQAARLAKMGYKVMRRDRRIDGKIIDMELTSDVLTFAIHRGFEMRGDPKLNRPNTLP